MKYQILCDSSGDFPEASFKNKNVIYKVIPLSILVGEQEFVDDDKLDANNMLKAMHAFKGKTSSACPSPELFLKELNNADYTFIITITQKLSGCYNSAMVAKNSYSKPENVCVIDSKATSGVMYLIVEELVRLIEEGKSYNQIVEEINKFRDQRTLFFILQKFDNLVANGRMSHVAGFIASTLLIRPLCRAVDGDIKIAFKLMGPRNAFQKLIKMVSEECKNKSQKIIITHCEDYDDAKYIEQELNKLGFDNIHILPMRGLTSYYALEKGIILCY